LVPCRWQRSGWKYVKVNPEEHKYFSNPNRVNSQGYSASSLSNKQPIQKFYGAGVTAIARDFDEVDRFANTTYGSFFNT
jgi:hypothetical protein